MLMALVQDSMGFCLFDIVNEMNRKISVMREYELMGSNLYGEIDANICRF